ncbi:glycosyltransferase family 39 protein [Leptolyngbya sp. FACHB-261]|uniref:glycosyltransferase family 39 protein n=1 Tax=Leptolyngbya sp. FACHB-261 TaxID=2692806 RepID=UPI001684F8CF|nr:glycosyltransferase family 39 protein [Leptolyngbya sp. FACHB-261]MBD2099573.1 glycosyltransferase family 39 protein [Leptolyngbya sp. FACHB-261]
MSLYNQPHVKWLKVLLVIVLALGVFFRFVNLDQKPYWHDEIYTSMRVSGYRTAEVVQDLYSDRVIDTQAVLKYQQPSPERNATDTLKGLAAEEPQHPPLYYVMARFWAEWFGGSITAMRSLPALISLLAFPAMYWLCWELFASPVVSWFAIALLSVSPIYIRYAQEARQYSLWIVIILLSSAALIRAMRYQTAFSWSIYALAVVAGLYCHLLSSLVFLGHGIYVVAVERFRLSRAVLSYLLASLIAVIGFIPWIQIAWMNKTALTQTTDWIKQPLPLLTLIRYWGVHLSRMFVAWHFKYDNEFVCLAIPVLILVIFALYFLCRQTWKRTWLFILTLIGVTALALVLPDLLWAGRRSTNIRYFLPSYLGLTIAVAYFLANSLTFKFTTTLQQRVCQLTIALLVSTSVLTSATASQASTWWGWSEFDVDVSQTINQSPNPLIISDMPLGMIIPLSHRLNSNIKMELTTNPDSLSIPAGFSDVFVYNPSDRLQAALKQRKLGQELTNQFEDNGFVVSLYRLNSAEDGGNRISSRSNTTPDDSDGNDSKL